MTFQLIRAARGWPRKDYSFEEIMNKARREGLTIRDGYGRKRIRQARQLVLSNGIRFRAQDDEKPTRAFGPRTEPEPA